MTTTERDDLVLDNLKLADEIARRKKKQISCVYFDDLQAAAYLGLVDAAVKYQPRLCPCFAAYATNRIRGAIQDYLRELAWGSRNFPVKIEPLFE